MVFFFFNQKTAYEMRISDWISDVCSSDQFFVDRIGDPTAFGGPPVDGLIGEFAAFGLATGANWQGRRRAGDISANGPRWWRSLQGRDGARPVDRQSSGDVLASPRVGGRHLRWAANRFREDGGDGGGSLCDPC